MNKDTEIAVLLQPETGLTESVSGFFFPDPLSIRGMTQGDTRVIKKNR